MAYLVVVGNSRTVYRFGTILSIVAGVVTAIASIATYVAGNRLEDAERDANAARDSTVVQVKGDLAEQKFAREQLAADLAAERRQNEVREQIRQTKEQERNATEAVLRLELEAAKREAAEAQRHIANATTEHRPREIGAEQRTAFLSKVGTKGKGTIEVSVVNGDAEARYFRDQLIELLRAGGWTISDTLPLLLDVSVEGLWLRAKRAENVPANGGTLQRALTAIGYETTGNVDEKVPEGKLELIVGHRPIIRSLPGTNRPFE